MIKNIIIFLLVVIAAYLFISDGRIKQIVNPGSKVEVAVEEGSKTGSNDSSVSNDNLSSGNSLDLSNQGLDKLPSYVLDRKSLEQLDISNNNLTGALPAEIRFLSNLRVLNASNNKMTGVPAEIGQLQKLEVLNLSNNELTGLPYEMGNLKNLKVLDLSGNNYSQLDLDIIKKDLPSDVEIIL